MPRKRRLGLSATIFRQRNTGKDGVELNRAEQQEEQAEDAQREAEVADAVDDERLDGRGIGRRLLVPEADQQVGGEAHAFPAEEHLQQVVRVTSISMAKVKSDR
jgi:hypothetical protein